MTSAGHFHDRSRLRLALLGATPASAAVAAALAEQADVQLLLVADESEVAAVGSGDAGLVPAGMQSVRKAPNWEELLSGSLVDAVVLGAGPEELRCEQLRRLVQAGVHVLVEHPVALDPLVVLEVEMIRGDTHAVVLPLLLDRWRPGLLELHRWLAAQAGPLRQLAAQRTHPEASNANVLRSFARDCDLLRLLAGELRQVTAIAPRAQDLSHLSVELGGSSAVSVRWNARPASDRLGLRIDVTVGQAEAELFLPDANGPGVLRVQEAGHWTERSLSEASLAAELARQFLAAIRGELGELGWNDAVQSLELTDAIERSLAKRRTIELYFETPSEQSTFKGLMAAGGCLILCLALFVTVLAVIVDQFWPALARLWPAALLLLLLVFLGLQLLRLVFASPAPDGRRVR